MRTNFSQAAKIFFTPETLVPFIIGAIFLSVLGNSVTQILFSIMGTSVKAALSIALGAVLIFGLSVLLFARGLSRLRSPGMKLNKKTPTKRRGLILLVSQEEPCRQAIRYHLPTLKKCWLICSQKTLGMANSLKSEFPKSKFPTLEILEPIVINDIYDPLDFYRAIKTIYARLPNDWSELDAIADFTGMTAHGSVGMVLASIPGDRPDRPLQYTPAVLGEDGKPTGKSLNPIEITLRPQTVETRRSASI